MLLRRVASLPSATALLCGLALLTAGCGSQTQADNATAQAKALAAQKSCINRAVNDAVLKQQDDAATQAALDGQDLTNCPADFVSSFVALRTSVRDYLQTRHEIMAHNGQANSAAGGDLLNLGCSVIAGKQCAPSAIIDWMNVDGELKNRDAENRTAYQKAMADLETVIARYGLYIRKPETSPTPNSQTPDASTGNAM